MRKLIVSLITLGLLGSGMVYLTSCAKQAGPLSPSVNMLGVSNADNHRLPQVTSWNNPSGVSGTAQVIFNIPMDAASFVKGSTVAIFTPDNDQATTESQYTAYSLAYNATSKTLYIIPDNNQWTDNKYYRLVLTTGIRSALGTQFDGNANNIAEDNAFDQKMYQFWIGSPTGVGYVLGDLTITGATMDQGAGPASIMSGYYFGDINYYNYVTFTVTFSSNMDSPGETYPLWGGGNVLPSWVSFRDANGAALTPVYVGMTTTAAGRYNDAIQVAFNFQPNTKYLMRLYSGLNGPRSTGNPTFPLERGRYLDLDGGGAEQNEFMRDMAFQTMQSVGPLAQVYVDDITTEGLNNTTPPGVRRFVVAYVVPTGIGQLDPATVNTSNFKVFYNSQEVLLNGIELDQTTNPGAPVVYLYLPLHFVNASTGYKTVRVWVSRNVQSSDGIKVDQNGDGVTGTLADDYSAEFSGTSVYNY